MNETPVIKKKAPFRFSSTQKDLLMLSFSTIFVLILSYYFNMFVFLVKMYQDHPNLLGYLDEIISGLVTLSVGLAVFSWRRWQELERETAARIKLQEENLLLANTRADTERIISKLLRSELKYHKKIEEELVQISRRQK